MVSDAPVLVVVAFVLVPPVLVSPVVVLVVWPAFVVRGTVVVATPVNPGPGTSIVIDL